MDEAMAIASSGKPASVQLLASSPLRVPLSPAASMRDDSLASADQSGAMNHGHHSQKKVNVQNVVMSTCSYQPEAPRFQVAPFRLPPYVVQRPSEKPLSKDSSADGAECVDFQRNPRIKRRGLLPIITSWASASCP